MSKLGNNLDKQVFDDDCDDNIVEMVKAAQQCSVDDPKNFKKLLVDVEKLLYPGCKKLTKLGTLVKLYHLKAKFEWSDTSFTKLLTLLKSILPKNNELSTSTYETKKDFTYSRNDLGKDSCVSQRLLPIQKRVCSCI